MENLEKNDIYKQIPAIMAEVGAIGKNKKNVQQGYSFRGIDDAYNALNSVMSKHGVFSVSKILQERTEEKNSKNGGVLIYRIFHIEYTFFAADGSFVKTETIGEGMDNGDKASNKAQAVAHKYALLQIFAVPTEELKDPENDSPEVIQPKQEQKAENNDGLTYWKTQLIRAKNEEELKRIGGNIASDETLIKTQRDVLKTVYVSQLEKMKEVK